ncbi:hypothetical protein ACFZB5_33555 [Streptomyces nodosus]|uniref:hypothetical protein n=1 Tax=Streptomyces nodosus TaxID=40318 RepID=UPI0036EC0249
MTLDAQAWVWRHSRTKGNARLVMLAVTDAITGPEAEVRMGTAEMMQRLNVPRSTARAAVDAALKSGELVEVEPNKGSRATLYRVPGAVNYRRNGPESGPIAAKAQGPNSGPIAAKGPDSGPSTGPESGPLAKTPEPLYGTEIRPPMGPESGPHHSPIEGMSEGGSEHACGEVAVIPEFARPLVDQITAAGVLVGWNLAPAEWFTVDALVKRSGLDMLATAAVQAAARNRRGVSHARYFLRAWQSLPPAPAPGTVPAAPPRGSNVVPFPTASAERPGRAAQAADWYADLLAEEQ